MLKNMISDWLGALLFSQDMRNEKVIRNIAKSLSRQNLSFAIFTRRDEIKLICQLMGVG